MATLKPLAFDNTKRTIVINGAGPAGLFAAILAISKGYNVLLLSDRLPQDDDSEYSRTQRLSVNNSATYELWKLAKTPEEQAFIQSIATLFSTAETRNIEKFLKEHLASLIEQKIRQTKAGKQTTGFQFIARRAEELELPDNVPNEVSYLRATRGPLQQINLDKGILFTLNHSDELKETPFDFLIDITAQQSAAFTIYHKGQKTFDKSIDTINQIHAAHGSTYLKLKIPGLVKPTFVPIHQVSFQNNDGSFKQEALANLGWTESYPPKVIILPDPEFTTFNVVGEIPNYFLDINDHKTRQQAMETWGRIVLSIAYGVNKDQFENPEPNNPVSTTTFSMKNISYNKEAYIEGKKATLIASGGPAYYPERHGLNDVFAEIKNIISCLPGANKNKQFNSQTFDKEKCKKHRDVRNTQLENIIKKASTETQNRPDMTATKQQASLISQFTEIFKPTKPNMILQSPHEQTNIALVPVI